MANPMILLIQYDTDEARFLVQAESKESAIAAFLSDREQAGCGDLDESLVYVDCIAFPVSGVREIGL